MRFKLDENFDPALAEVIAARGHEADSVLGEQLSGAADERIYGVCIAERRVLLTLDLDFSNPLRFPPEPTEGIIVLRPLRPILPLIGKLLTDTLPTIERESPRGRLWIVEPGRVRIFNP